MINGRPTFLLVLVAVPATLAFWKGDSKTPKSNCDGLSKQVQDVQDGVDGVSNRLGDVATDTQSILQNQDERLAVGLVLRDGEAIIRKFSADILQKQTENVEATLEAVSDVEKNLQEDLKYLEGDVPKLSSGQDELQSILEQTASDLGEGNDLIEQGLGEAQEERGNLAKLVQKLLGNTEGLTGSVHDLSDSLEDLEYCANSLCPKRKSGVWGYQ